MAVIKPPRLKRGDLIGIVAPSSPPATDDRLNSSISYIERQGFRVQLGKHIHSRKGYLAGEDAERAGDINDMFASKEVKAVFALRGGYGAPRLLPLIKYDKIKRAPKIFVGFSDLTALQLALFKKAGLITFSGPMPAVDFCNEPDPFTEANFWSMLTEPQKSRKLPNAAGEALVRWGKGKAEGRLLGGNLAMVSAMLGSPYIPSFAKALLVLEEVGEFPYRVDRMLTHLRNAEVYDDCAGILLGHFTRCESADKSSQQLTIDQILADIFGPCKKPIIGRVQYGHIHRKLTLPLGAKARMNAEKLEIEILESPVT